jgi:hypothetical protein
MYRARVRGLATWTLVSGAEQKPVLSQQLPDRVSAYVILIHRTSLDIWHGDHDVSVIRSFG